MNKPIPPPPPVTYSSDGPQPKREKRTRPVTAPSPAKVERVLGFRMTTIQYRKVK
jgi:hypothetical protein